MARHSLTAYVVRVRERESADSAVNLDRLPGGLGLAALLREFLDRNPTLNLESEEKYVNISELMATESTLEGVIEIGPYGESSRLIDTENDAETYRPRRTEASVLPYRFLLAYRDGRNEGILVVQRRGQLGAKSVLEVLFRSATESDTSELTLDINPLTYRKAIQRLIDRERIVRVRFVSFDIKGDIRQQFDAGDHTERKFKGEFVVMADRNRSIPFRDRLAEWARGERSVDRLVEIEGMSYDTVKVEVRNKGGTRTIDLGEPENFTYREDVTDRLAIDSESGHPAKDSLRRLMRELTDDLFRSLYDGGIEGL